MPRGVPGGGARRVPSQIDAIGRGPRGAVVLCLDCSHDVVLRAPSPLARVGGGWPCRYCPPLAPLLPAVVTGYHARPVVPRRGVVVVLAAANESETFPTVQARVARAVGSRGV